MPDHMTDAEIILVALLNGVLLWVPSVSGSGGELWMDGARTWTNRHDNGLPKISVKFRRALIEKLAPS